MSDDLRLVEKLDFAVGGLTSSDDPDAHIVAIVLEPERALMSVKAVAMHDWDEVIEVVSALLASAVTYWGEPPPELRALPFATRTEH